MKGDFSRRTFAPGKHYSAVLVEQGRMLTDADSEEEHRILSYRAERAAGHIIGACGAPLPSAGFGLSTPDNVELRIGAGPFYAAGTLLENDSEVVYTDQPDRFDPPWPLPEGRHAIVLDSWRRLITALDDPSIREVALGGPTTSSRERVVWQVGAVPVDADWDCSDDLPAAGETTGELAARAEPDETAATPCLIPPQAGYTGLENQFYRVEIFDSGPAYDVPGAADTFTIDDFPAGSANQVTLSSVAGLEVGNAVEVYRTGVGFDPIEATFAHITEIDGQTLTLTTSLPAFGPTDVPVLRLVGASFVVSRDNGSVVTTIEAIDELELTVHDLGPDDVLGFAIGQLVELSDDRIELERQPRRLHEIADIKPATGAGSGAAGRVIVLRTPAEPLAAGPTGVEADWHPKLRRWDAAGAVRFRPGGNGWIHLEQGNEVRFTDGNYRTADYWYFPARAATVDAASGTIEWPQEAGEPALRSPFGIDRHRCVLGHLDIDAQGNIGDLEDCRNLFPPLTSLRMLLYVGGDGQEGSPADAAGGFIPLPGRLAVRVANGGFPVPGATVRFRLVVGGGRLEGGGPTVDVVTDANGIASAAWEIDTAQQHQVCMAFLLNRAGDPIDHQVATFHATIDQDEGGGSGCCWSIGAGGDYATLDAALDDLIGRSERDICLCLRPGDHEYPGGSFTISPEAPATHLSIRGCGRGSRLRIRKPLELEGWAAVRFADLDMFLSRDATVQMLDVADVEIRDCQIFGLRSNGGLVGVHGSDRLQVTGCVLVALRPEVFVGLNRFFDGLGPLAQLWQDEDETALREILAKGATEVAGMTAAARRGLLKKLTTKLADLEPEYSRGEVDAIRRLADVIAGDPRIPPMARALDLVARAAAVVSPGVALEISGGRAEDKLDAATRASVVIADNVVPGIITFYGQGEVGAVVAEDILKRLDGLVGDNAQILGTAGDVHIRDNRLGQLALSVGMIKLLNLLVENPQTVHTAYESFLVSGNMIDGAVTEIVSRHTALTSNDFTLAALPIGQVPPNGIVANVIGDTATYTGNHGRVPAPGVAPSIVRDITRTSAEAVNLELQIL